MTQQRVVSKDQLHAIAFFALVLGIKFMVVANYGNTIPFWDQWDVEIDRFYRPWLEGNLDWFSLIAPHNEHRVFTGRVLALLLFVLGGNVINPMLQIAVNAVLHTVVLLLLLQALLRALPDSSSRLPVTLVVALIFAVPLGVENILFNNSALYFLILFGILFIHALSRSGNQSILGWFAPVFATALLGCLSFASGAITLAAGVALLAVQWLTGVRRNHATIIMIVMLSVMMLVSVHFTPSIPAHASYKSRSLVDFALSMLSMTGGLVFYVPSAVFIYRQIRRKPEAGDASWFLFTLLLWVAGQMLILAYGRGHRNVMASRYLDLYTIGFVANFLALFVNMKDPALQWSLKPLRIWLVLFFTLIGVAFPKVSKELQNSRAEVRECESRVSAYLRTQDQSVLDEPEAKIPYPDPVRLKQLLDQKIVQSMLPPFLAGDDGQSGSKAKSKFPKALFIAGSILAGIGTGLFCSRLFDASVVFGIGKVSG
jgi:hypothetical protein